MNRRSMALAQGSPVANWVMSIANKDSESSAVNTLLNNLVQMDGVEQAIAWQVVDKTAMRLLDAAPSMVKGSFPSWALDLLESLKGVRQRAGVRQFQAPEGTGTILSVGVPRSPGTFLAVHCHPETGADLARIMSMLECMTAVIPLTSIQSQMAEVHDRLDQLHTVADLVSAIDQQTTLEGFTMAVCNEIGDRWDVTRVSLGLLRKRHVKIKAMSNAHRLKRHMRLVQDLEMAMEECLDQAEPVKWDPGVATTKELALANEEGGVLRVVNRAAETYSNRHGPVGLYSLPLILGDNVVGVISAETAPDKPMDSGSFEQLQLFCELIPGRIDALRRSERSFFKHSLDAVASGFKWVLRPKHTGVKLIALIVAAVIAWVVFVETDYNIYGKTTVAALNQRVVTAPFQGILAEVNCEPGDVVSPDPESGPILVFDSAEIALQKASKQAELLSFQREADKARAEGQHAQQQIALAQAERIQADIDLLMHRIESARIMAPTEGTVISEDLSLLVGTRINLGQELLAVVPTDSMVVDLAVPEGQIADFRAGMTGSFTPVSHPDQVLSFVVERIRPTANPGQTGNTFLIRARLEDIPEWLRPGMTGQGVVTAGQQTRWWIWTRPVRNWLAQQAW